MLLLAASYYFYMAWKPAYVLLIVLSTLIDYYSALGIYRARASQKKKLLLYLSLASNLGLLFIFKYFNFFTAEFNHLATQLEFGVRIPYHQLLLPMGISFYTFQTLSYTIDVYRGEREPEHHLGIFAVYVSFFPQLVAGPIERSTSLLPQFFTKHAFSYDRFRSGLRLMAWGFFKKLVIADRLSLFVDPVYNSPETFSGIALSLATFFFAFQIYCDFSGYSDIAIGTARIMGFDLMKNFRSPYFATSVREFWQRWHISLSTWFKDYLYISLGGNRVLRLRWYFNLFFTFLVSGLWHGANWTFLLWGALHGFYLVTSLVTRNIREWLKDRLNLNRLGAFRWVQAGITFLLVLVAWVFFRAGSVGEALYIIKNVLRDLNIQYFLKVSLKAIGWRPYELAIAFLSIIGLLLVEVLVTASIIKKAFFELPIPVRWACYYAFFWGILLFGEFGYKEFIYFQF